MVPNRRRGRAEEWRTPGLYTRVDLRANRDVLLRHSQISFYLEVTNLLNRENECCLENYESNRAQRLALSRYRNRLLAADAAVLRVPVGVLGFQLSQFHSARAERRELPDAEPLQWRLSVLRPTADPCRALRPRATSHPRQSCWPGRSPAAQGMFGPWFSRATMLHVCAYRGAVCHVRPSSFTNMAPRSLTTRLHPAAERVQNACER